MREKCAGPIHIFRPPQDKKVCECGTMVLEYAVGKKTVRNITGEKVRRFDFQYDRGALHVTIADSDEPEIITHPVYCCDNVKCPGFTLTEIRHADYSEWCVAAKNL